MVPPIQFADVRHEGVGAIPHDEGVAFRVWALHADAVHVSGSFNDWDENGVELEAEGDGYWYVDVPDASIGDEYRFIVVNGDQRLYRIDPRAREVTNSIGNAVVHDPHFDWRGDDFVLPSWNELVLYELHVGTFHRHDPQRPGTFEDATAKLDYLADLGVNAVQLMPVAEFAGDWSWGYNAAHPYAVEGAYGGPTAMKEFVRAAHERGIGVICDVVYNHFGPSDLHLWQFDGWSENGKGGIYFYNDWRSSTPWGDTRPDYGRGDVRQYIRDNAVMWLEEYHADGLRYDMTLYMRSVDGTGEMQIPEGWSLAQWINRDVRKHHPRHITIAEDMQNLNLLTASEEHGGANFGSQWDAGFVHPIRDVLTQLEDEHRSMESIRGALLHRYNLDVFERVIYSESHDEVANGKSRVPSEIDPDDPASWAARKRSILGSALVLTAPGIPMLLQGQEFLRDGWFDDGRALDWSFTERFPCVLRVHTDLIHLRRNLDGTTAGLTGQHIDVHHVDDEAKVVAYRRWLEGGPGDETLVICNFSVESRIGYRVGVSNIGTWHLRCNTDWEGYGPGFGSTATFPADAIEEELDGLPASLTVDIGPYTMLVFSQEP